MKDNKNKRTLEVCFSPALFHLCENIEESIVVVIDILRATSTITTALEKGAESVIPVSTIEESRFYQKKGFLVAAERHGKKIDGFQFGNSPLELIANGKLNKQNLVITTTNGTRAIRLAKNANKVVIGSFLNMDILIDWLKTQDRDVICLCAGWKNKFNLEDAVFAGALVYHLKDYFDDLCDSAIAAEKNYIAAKDNLKDFLKNSSHYKRLSQLGVENDISFCFSVNKTQIIPVLKENCLVKM